MITDFCKPLNCIDQDNFVWRFQKSREKINFATTFYDYSNQLCYKLFLIVRINLMQVLWTCDLMSSTSDWLSHWYDTKTWAGAGTPCSSSDSRTISRTSKRFSSFRHAHNISTLNLQKPPGKTNRGQKIRVKLGGGRGVKWHRMSRWGRGKSNSITHDKFKHLIYYKHYLWRGGGGTEEWHRGPKMLVSTLSLKS